MIDNIIMPDTVSIVTLKTVTDRELRSKHDAGLKNPDMVSEVIKDYIGDNDREHLIVVGVNTKNQVNVVSTISIGTISESPGTGREVFKVAILHNCAKIFIGHNHPSGKVDPSRGDIVFTEKIVEIGNLLGISVLDHIIVTETDHYSMRKNDDVDFY